MSSSLANKSYVMNDDTNGHSISQRGSANNAEGRGFKDAGTAEDSEEEDIGLQLNSSSSSTTHSMTSHAPTTISKAQIEPSNPSTTTAKTGGICNDGLSHLIRATRSCVEACEKARKLVDESSDLLDAYHIHEDIREVALSLATLDRTLNQFCGEVLEEAGERGSVATVESRSLASVIDRIQNLPASIQLKRLPPGGLTSLLYHFHVTLDDANNVMDTIQPSWTIGVVRWLYPIMTVVSMVFIHRKMLMSSSRALRRRWPASLALALLAILLYRRLQHQTGAIKSRLRQVHKQLMLLLRIWLVSVDTFKTANISKNKSYALMLDNVTDNEGPQPAARKLLEEAYLPKDAMLWCKKNRPLALLKYGLDCVYAGFGVGFWVKQSVSPLLEWPVSVISILYFACRPESASQCASRTLKKCSAEFVQRVWLLLDSTPARMLAGLTLPDLPFNESLNIAGCPCHLFSADDRALEIRKLKNSRTCPFPGALLRLDDAMIGNNELLPHPSNSNMDNHETHGSKGANLVNTQPHMPKLRFRQTLHTIISPNVGGPSEGQPDHFDNMELPGPADSTKGEKRSFVSSFGKRSLSSVGLGYFTEKGEFKPNNPVTDSANSQEAHFANRGDVPGRVVSNVELSNDGEIEEYNLSSSLMYEGSSPSENIENSDCAGGPPTLLYIHGGGYIGCNFASDATFLSQWAKQHGFTVVYAHYSLSPQHVFPVAVNECMCLYQCLRYRAKCNRIVVAADSAGGNIATAMVVRCITSGIRTPDALVLAYPSLNLNVVPSPSRALHLNDPLIPMGLMLTLANAYKPDFAKHNPTDNAYLHPGCATDRVLQYFPTTSICVGGLDPLLDDSIDFNTRLRRVGVTGSLKVFRSLPHGFFNFNWLPMAGEGLDTARRWISYSLGIESPSHN